MGARTHDLVDCRAKVCPGQGIAGVHSRAHPPHGLSVPAEISVGLVLTHGGNRIAPAPQWVRGLFGGYDVATIGAKSLPNHGQSTPGAMIRRAGQLVSRPHVIHSRGGDSQWERFGLPGYSRSRSWHF